MRAADLPPELAHLPICPHRELPIPFIAEVGGDGAGHFTILDPDRQRECYEHRLCAMCGLPMGDEVALIGDVVSLEPGGFYIEPPVHEWCGWTAIGGLCPYISREKVPRRPHDPNDTTIAVLGTLADLARVTREEAKRPVVMGIYRTYIKALHLGGTSPMPVFTSLERPVRVRRYRWEGNRAVEVDPQPPPGPPLRVVALHHEAPPPECPAPLAGTQNDGSAGAAAPRRQPRRLPRSQRRRGRHRG